MKTIKTIISKAAALRKAKIDVCNAEHALRSVPVESILNPHIGKKFRITKDDGCGGRIEILTGELIHIYPSWIQLDNVQWETEHEYIYDELRHAIIYIEDMINIEIL